MRVKIAILIAQINFCVSYNISWLLMDPAERRLTSGEKIKSLIDEEAKKGKTTGYDLVKIKLSNEVIIQLMDKGSKKEHGEEMLKLMSEYTVGMNENTMDIVLHNDLKNRWKLHEEVFRFGKPTFIEHECSLSSMQARFGWKDGPVDYFNYIRKDARKAWDLFVKEFTKISEMIRQPVRPASDDS